MEQLEDRRLLASQLFTGSGIFAVPAGVASVNVLAVGGGGGGANGHQGGGGSGYVSVGSIPVTPGASIPVTVGAGGTGAVERDDNFIVGLTPGTASSFGALLTANGGGVVSGINQGGHDGASGGGAACNAGEPGGAGGTGGTNGAPCQLGNSMPIGMGQGSYTSSLSLFTEHVVAAGAGGAGGTGTHAGGGGAGGILINGGGPNAGDGSQAFSGKGGAGYGAGGGAGGYNSSFNGTKRFAGGNGADGLVYIEWSSGSLNAALDGSGNLTITDVDSSGRDNDLSIMLVNGGLDVEISDPAEEFTGAPAGGVLSNGNRTLTIPLSQVTGNITITTAGGSDMLTVDFSTGDPIPSGGLTYDGGAGGSDGLAVVGNGTTTTATYTPDATTAGEGTVLANGTSTISFSNLEPVDISGMVTATVASPANPANAISMAPGFDFATGLISAIVVSGNTGLGPTLIEAAHLFNNTNVVLDTSATTGAGANTITAATAVTLGHNNTNLTLKTNANGSVTVNAALAVSGTIDVQSPTVNLNDNIAAASITGTGTTVNVNNNTAQIQDGIGVAAATGATITVAAGTYLENLILNKEVTLKGAQFGADARGRVVGAPNPATETIVASSGAAALDLQSGSNAAVIDGFSMVGSFSAAYGVIGNSSGTNTNLQVKNNYVLVAAGFTASALYMNRPAEDATFTRNEFVAAAGSSQAVFFDGPDAFHGLQFTDNNVLRSGAVSGTGFFVDGNRNIGTSASLATPLIKGNLFQGHSLGFNGGTRAFESAQIVENTFTGNQGGLGSSAKNSTIARNTFSSNEYYGLRLTNFGSGLTDPLRGAQGTIVENNTFFGNGTSVLGTGYGDVRIDNQADGLQATNVIRNNSFGSTVAVFVNETSGELLNLSGNWWGDATGPLVATNPDGIGGSVLGTGAATVDFSPWLDVSTDTDGGAPGFQGSFSVLHVEDTSPHSTYLSAAATRVQEAINLVTASEVILDAGTYNENVVASVANLLLRGGTGNPADVILNGSSPSPIGGTGVQVSDDNVTIKDLRITGYATGIATSGALKTALTLTNLLVDTNSMGANLASITTLNVDTNNNGQEVNINTNGAGSSQFNVTGAVQYLDYSSVGTLDIDTLDGDDTVHVSPHATTVIDLDGGPHSVGDTLVYHYVSATNNFAANPTLTTGYADINHVNFESFTYAGGPIHIIGSGLNDQLTITASGSNSGSYQLIEDYTGGTPTVNPVVNFLGIPSFTFDGGAGNDWLVINNPGGGRFAPASGIFYNGETNSGPPGDKLSIVGGAATTVEHEFTNANDGFIKYNGSTVITYTGLEPVDESINAANKIFTFTGADEAVILSDDGTPNDTVSKIDSDLGEVTTFTNPSTSLTVNLTSGTDTLEVQGLDSMEPGPVALSINLTINGDDSDTFTDTVNFTTGTTNIGGGNANIGTTGGEPIQTIDFSGGTLQTTGDVFLTAVGGIATSAAGNDVTANNLTANAGTDIDLETTVATLVAHVTTAGSILIDETDGITLTDVDTFDGQINVGAGGTIVATDVASLTDNDANDIFLTAVGAAANISVTTISAGAAGDVNLSAGNDVLDTNSADANRITADALVVDAANGTADATDGIVLDTLVSSLDASVTGGAAGGNINIDETNAIILTDVDTVNGSITVDAGGQITATDVQSATDANVNDIILTNSSGDIVVGLVSAGTTAGDVYLNAAAGIEEDGTADGSADIVGQDLELVATAGIGDDAQLEIDAVNLAGTTSTGDIDLLDTAGGLTIDDVNVDGADGATSGVSITGGAGGWYIRVVAFSPLTVNSPVSDNTGGNITLAANGNLAADDVDLNADVTATGGSGGIRIYAGDSIDVDASVTISAAGTGVVLLSASTDYNNGGGLLNGLSPGNSDVVMQDGSTVQSEDGNITLRGSGSISLSSVNADSDGDLAAGDIVVTADYAGVGGGLSDNSGAISDNLTGEAPNLVGDQVALRAGSGIGAGGVGAATDIDTAVRTLAAVTESGDINIQDIGIGLTIDTFNGLSGVTITDALATNSGEDLTIVTRANLTVAAGNPITNNDGGDITLRAQGGGGYALINDIARNFTNAQTNAASLGGYLATIRSAAENAAVLAVTLGMPAWIGASDGAFEDDWLWVTGPDAGTQFWSGAVLGSPVGGEYNNWDGGEPNQSGDEDATLMYTIGEWLDVSELGTWAYVLEFADANVDVNAAVTVTGGTGDITLQADNDVTGDAAGDITTADGDVMITADLDGSSFSGTNANGTIQMEGDITAGTGTVTFSLADCNGWLGQQPSPQGNGEIISASDVIKNGGGALRLNGAANTYTGTTTVNAGALLVNGVISGAGGLVTVNSGGTLGGDGDGTTTGLINRNVTVLAGGILDPGDVSTADCSPLTGKLTVTGNVVIDQFGFFRVQINGLTPRTDYDQLRVNGTVDLTGDVNGNNASILTGTAATLPFGGEYRIIDNDAAEDILNDSRFMEIDGSLPPTSYLPLPEGAFVTTFGQLMNISYRAGDNKNDVVLTTPGRFDFDGYNGNTAQNYIGVSPFDAYTGPVGDNFGWDVTAPAPASLPPQYFEREYTPVPPCTAVTEPALRLDGQATNSLGAPLPLRFLLDVEAGKTYEVLILTGDVYWNHDRQQFRVFDTTVYDPGNSMTYSQQVVDTWGAGAPDGSGVTVTSGGGTTTTCPTYYRWVRMTLTVGGALGSIRTIGMEMQDNGGYDGSAVILGMDVRPLATVGQIVLERTLSSGSAADNTDPFGELPADGVTIDSYQGTGAPPNSTITVTVSAVGPAPAFAVHYATVLTDTDPALFGTQVTADATGLFTFTVQRPAALADTSATTENWTVLAEERSGLSRGTATQVYGKPAAEALRFDFGVYGSPVQTYGAPVKSFLEVIPQTTYNAARGYGWTSRVAGAWRKSSGMSDLRTDLNYARDATFKVNLPDGNYSVRIYHSNPMYYGTVPYIADNFDVWAEGAVQYNVADIPAGTSDIRTFNVIASGGALELRFQDLGGRDGNFVVSGIDISAVGQLPAEQALLASGDPLDGGAPAISVDMLQPVVAEAAARWSAAGLTPAQAATLANVQYAVADLGGAYLGLANPATNTIRIDDDAAMIGWSVVRGPWMNGIPGTTDNGQRTTNGIDLLTVVMHEMGHLLGHEHSDDDHDLMAPVLSASPLRTSAVPNSVSPDLSLNLSPNLSPFALRSSSSRADDLFADLGRKERTAADRSDDAVSALLDSAEDGLLAAQIAKSGDEAAEARVPRRSRMERFERELDDWFAELAAEEEAVGG